MKSRTKFWSGNKTPIGISLTDGKATEIKALKAVQGTMKSGRDLANCQRLIVRCSLILSLCSVIVDVVFYDLTIDHLNDAQALHNVDAMLLSILAKNVDIMIDARRSDQ